MQTYRSILFIHDVQQEKSKVTVVYHRGKCVSGRFKGMIQQREIFSVVSAGLPVLYKFGLCQHAAANVHLVFKIDQYGTFLTNVAGQ